MIGIFLSIVACLGAFAASIAILRRSGASLGLPVAYLFGLLLLHVPGAIAHFVGQDYLADSDLTETGIALTAIGALSFVAGMALATRRRTQGILPESRDRAQFWFFCLLGGWTFTFAFTALARIPSVSAALDKGGALWMLGVSLGLQYALRRGRTRWTLFWLSCLAVYPVLMLLLGGFLSYGATAVTIVLAGLAVSIRSAWRVAAGAIVIAVLGINGFINYFEHRENIRDAVWGGAPFSERVDATAEAFRHFQWFDPSNDAHLGALDQRLNQNYFAGLAASRIDQGQVEYLYGRSLWEGLISLVPRLVWPDKPVHGGSPQIVSEMTGLYLSEHTAWGVGNVMEFHINFGVPGLIVGFLALGYVLGALDRRAAVAERSGDLGRAILYFLPAAALVQPIGSLVELSGGAAAAMVAGFGWRAAWRVWSSRRQSADRMRDEELRADLSRTASWRR